MLLGRNNIICAFPYGERLVIAEANGKAPARSEIFSLPGGLMAGGKNSQALKSFLAANHFRTRRVVLALPSREVTVIKKQIPSRSVDEVRQIVKLEQGTYFALAIEEMLTDFRIDRNLPNGSEITVFGCRKNLIAAANALFSGAGLSLAAACPGTYSFFNVMSANAKDALIFIEQEGVLDCCAVSDGAISLTRSIPLAGSIETGLTPFLTQTSMIFPEGANVSISCHATAEVELAVNRAAEKAFAGKTIIPDVVISATLDTIPAKVFAENYAKLKGTVVDFMHSSLSETKHRHHGKEKLYGSLAAAVLILVFAGMYGWLSLEESALHNLEGEIENIKDASDRAEEAKKILDAAAPWLGSRTSYLGLLSEISSCFPNFDGIWTGNLSIKDGTQTIISGKADSDQKILSLLDALKKSPRCNDATLLYIRSSERTSSDKAFSIRFNFKGGAK